MEKPYVSPRAIAEAEKQYRQRRFDQYVDDSAGDPVKRALAITAFKEEIAYLDEVESEQSNGTISTT